jgi:hypothetical protein
MGVMPRHRWLRPVVPCTLLGVVIGLASPLEWGGYEVPIAGAVIGLLVGLGFDALRPRA